MRYYDLDQNGWPRASFARPQRDRELLHLPDQPSDHHRWDGTKWVEDAYEKNQARLAAMQCTRWAARLTLQRAGLIDEVEALAANDYEFRIWYEDRQVWSQAMALDADNA